LRAFLDGDGFIEVDTPVLQPIYGGAQAKPFVTHHHALDIDLYLRISDELYLKRLIVGGFDRVYEIGRDFRNEGIDRQHNPEFTMLEFYWAYADYEDLMKYTETMLASLVKELKGSYKFMYQGTELNFTPPWPRKTYRDVVLEYSGVDINKASDEKKLLAAIKAKKIKLDLVGVVGFGALLDTLYKATARPHLVGPMYLTDRPTAFVALAKRLPADPTKTASFQLLVAGKEILNAYNELNDPEDQAKRWHESEKLGLKGQNEHEAFDADYIRALEYGMPPTAGWGLGIDRLVAILTDQPNIKDVILFPTLRPESA
jgi:lysyl-tRNA synthetase class 2